MDCGLPSGSFGHWRQALEEGEKLRADCGLPPDSLCHRPPLQGAMIDTG